MSLMISKSRTILHYLFSISLLLIVYPPPSIRFRVVPSRKSNVIFFPTSLFKDNASLFFCDLASLPLSLLKADVATLFRSDGSSRMNKIPLILSHIYKNFCHSGWPTSPLPLQIKLNSSYLSSFGPHKPC